MDTEEFDLLEQLDDYLFDACQELVATPFFLFKSKWQLTAKIQLLKSIIHVIKRHK